MRSLIFEPFSGAAGDMILASLIGLGADRKKIKEVVESAVDVSIDIGSVNKRGILATDVQVHVAHETHHRYYHEIVDLVKDAGLPGMVEESTLGVFSLMAEAESKVHGVDLDELHFHEVGQNDALADVIGSCLAIHDIAPDSILSTSVNTGGGSIKAAHGTMAVPAPATLEILRQSGLSFYGAGNRELLTPTGAALLAYFARSVEGVPRGRAVSVAYGAGDADTENPNVLRAMLMDVQGTLSRDHIEILETNVDDVTSEVLGNLFDRLLLAGAKDLTIVPATMKKGRPGHIIKVITKPQDSDNVARVLMKETGTLGVRVIPVKHRYITDRRMEKVTLSIGSGSFDVPIKIAYDRTGEILNMSAEYDDCTRISEKVKLPLKEVMRRAENEAWERFG